MIADVVESLPYVSPPVEIAQGAGIVEAPRKIMAIRLRWLLVIICSYLLIYSDGETLSPSTVDSLILLYILTNAALYWINERSFESSYFYAPLVLFDTFYVTASLVISGQAGTDFYLAYFLIIILCAVLQDFHGVMVVGSLSSIVYGYLLFSSVESSDPSIYLRPPFLFVVSLFYGYFTQIVRLEKSLREQADRQTMIAKHLTEVERLKFEFLANTTHELRTPLTAIMGYGELLLTGCFGPLTQEQKMGVGRLMDSATGLFGLVEQILDYSKLEKGETGLFVKRQDFGPWINQIRQEIAPLEGKRSYKVQYEIERDLPPIETDWSKLRNILINVLSNAIKFTEKGEVKLSVRNSRKGEVSFAVSDTGIGIPKEELPLIFERFRQLDGSQTRRYGGAGLGLTISKNLIDLIGGRLEVQSAVGRGSTFVVTIPLAGS